ncbi:MAG TPA: serine protease, partial [Deferrisomatales bacterium]|nr:serine protease [Deferrisomatales bacterium]
MRRWRCAVFGAAALCLAATGVAARGGAEDMYAAVGDRVVQVQIIDVSSGSRAGLGSGFLVDAGGVLATNYHVIAHLVYRPGQYRAEYRTRDGLGGRLELLAVDVVRDLALLRADTLSAPPLELEPGEAARGERLFSFGNPLDLGLTVVEGTFNGYLEQSLLRKIHFTGSINPGMSGGPTVNARGRVVGINVSTAGNQVSFLVPAEHLAALVENRAQAPGDWLETVAAQLLAHQEGFAAHILAEPLVTATLGPF